MQGYGYLVCSLFVEAGVTWPFFVSTLPYLFSPSHPFVSIHLSPSICPHPFVEVTHDFTLTLWPLWT